MRASATLASFAARGVRSAAPLALIALAACATTGTVPTDLHAADQADIRAARLAQNEAIAVGDPDGIAAFWTDDVIVRPALSPPITGRDAYRQAFAADPPGLVFVRTPVTIVVSDRWPMAFESGEWTKHLAGAQSPPVVAGRYSAQWVKRSGRWLIRAEVFVPLHCEAAGCSQSVPP